MSTGSVWSRTASCWGLTLGTSSSRRYHGFGMFVMTNSYRPLLQDLLQLFLNLVD